jgi:hypothetical protein
LDHWKQLLTVMRTRNINQHLTIQFESKGQTASIRARNGVIRFRVEGPYDFSIYFLYHRCIDAFEKAYQVMEQYCD